MNAQRAGGTLSPIDADEVVTSWFTADARDGGRHAEAWEELDDIVGWLLRASGRIKETGAKERWLRTPWSRLESAPTSTHRPPAAAAVRWQRHPTADLVGALPPHRFGRAARATARVPAPHGGPVASGLPLGPRPPARELDAVTVGNLLDEQNLRSTAKLAGLRAANIAGFLSRDWRLNDWWWGRLDAASGIVEFFSSLPSAPKAPDRAPTRQTPPPTDRGRRPRAGAPRTPRSARRRSHRQRRGHRHRPEDGAAHAPQPPGSDGVPRAQATRERFVRGTQGFDALSDSYRVAIASRTLRAASSALTHGERATSPSGSCTGCCARSRCCYPPSSPYRA